MILDMKTATFCNDIYIKFKNLDYWFFQHQHFFILKSQNTSYRSQVSQYHMTNRGFACSVSGLSLIKFTMQMMKCIPEVVLSSKRGLGWTTATHYRQFQHRFVSKLFILLRNWMDSKCQNGSAVFAMHIQNIASNPPHPTGTLQKMTSTCKDDNLRKKKGKNTVSH